MKRITPELFGAVSEMHLALPANEATDMASCVGHIFGLLTEKGYTQDECDLLSLAIYYRMVALAELVEASVRSGNSGLAAEALERLVEVPSTSGAEWGLGIVARSRALVSENEAADALYLEAITRLGRTPLRPELARAHLVYGEWLRRENRRMDAREQLRTAHEMFISFGADAFAERTRRELLATGEKVRKRSDETRGQLTAQEEQIARLAADAQTNQEIGAQLFLSPRTIEWHLHKVFTKLGVASRMQLRDKLPDAARAGAPA